MTRLLLVRHGETDWNADGRVQGHLDVPLNEAGRAQARRVAAALAGAGIAAVYSSDLSRAADTAASIAARVGLDVRRDPALRERHLGAWQGMTITEVARRFPDEYRCHREGVEFAPQGGETFREFQDRVCDAVDRIAALHEDQTVVIVMHGGPVKVFVLRLLAAPFTAHTLMRTGNTGITTVLRRDGRYVLESYNVTDHLRAERADAEEPDRESQLVTEMAL